MEILKDISRDKLIIMVTHNPELAERYSTRIIRAVDGRIIGDTNPYEGDPTPVKTEEKSQKRQKKQKTDRKPCTHAVAIRQHRQTAALCYAYINAALCAKLE
jgi:energy-coupling factor transporter ATP-binding protein EcfA2